MITALPLEDLSLSLSLSGSEAPPPSPFPYSAKPTDISDFMLTICFRFVCFSISAPDRSD